MAANFCNNVEALASHVGTTFVKVPHIASKATHQIKAPIIEMPDEPWGKTLPLVSLAKYQADQGGIRKMGRRI